MEVAIVILNWNGKHWLEKFLPSVVSHLNPKRDVLWIADNASTDDSIEWLKANYPDVELLEMKENTGYAGGYHEALNTIEADYFVLLNSDIEVGPDWLDPMIDRMNSHAHIAACQPKILSYDNKDSFEYAGACGGYIDRLGYPFCRGRILNHCEKDEGQYDEAQPIFWATGACLVVRSSAYHSIGGLHAPYFAHMEEIDLCWRFQRAGFEVWVEPQSIVYHVGGGSLSQTSPFKTELNFRNNLLLLFRNIHPDHRNALLFKRMVWDGLAGAIYLLTGRWKLFMAVIKAHNGFRAMKAQEQQDSFNDSLGYIPQHELKHCFNGHILVQAILRGKKTFASLNQALFQKAVNR